MVKRKQTQTELLAHLREQVELLVHYCENFDQGKLAFSKPIATVLRVLLHTKEKSTTKALLDQLGLRNGRWRAISGQGHPRDSKFPCPLISVFVEIELGAEGSSAGCEPKLKLISDGIRRTSFSTWWTEPVAYNHNSRKEFSRMDIVRSVTDTDGGAHVDQSLDEYYVALRDGEFLGVRALASENSVGINFSYTEGLPIPGAVGAALRTIAHETLLTLEERVPEAFAHPYIFKAS